MTTLTTIGTTNSGKKVSAFGPNEGFTKADHSEACDFFASAAFKLQPDDIRRKILRAKALMHFNLSK